MFGTPKPFSNDDAVFPLVWTYNIKAEDGWKKAQCTCNGSLRTGRACVFNETYTNCVDQTSSRLFYAIAAAENPLSFGANVSNAFAEAPLPKQGFFICPNCASMEWWTQHRKNPPLDPNNIIPVLSAMQGHSESLQLWEKHANAILQELGLTPTVHEPCLYSNTINGNHIILKCQVDNFAIAAPNKIMANILLDKIDDKLSIPIKHQGYLDMYNKVDVLQTRNYIKISSYTFINKIGDKYLVAWMHNFTSPDAQPTPLPTNPTWYKKFKTAVGDPDPKVQAHLAKTMQISYRSGVGELIWAITTTLPDLAFTGVKLSQASSAPHEHHYHGVKHALKYLYSTHDDCIYF